MTDYSNVLYLPRHIKGHQDDNSGAELDRYDHTSKMIPGGNHSWL